MKPLKFIIIFALFGGIFSCKKKEYPQPLEVVNSAVYYSKITIDGRPINLEAGVDGYYMYSSYKLDENFVYTFIADLKKTDCSNCANSLKIQINDYRSSLLIPTKIDTSLRPVNYPILNGDPGPSYKVVFQATNPSSTYSWIFGNGKTSSVAQPTVDFKTSGKYNVVLKTENSNGCASSIYNLEKINVNNKSCKITIQSTEILGNVINFSILKNGGTEPLTYLWDFGDGNTSTQSTPTNSYKYQGAYAVNVRVIDKNNDTAYASYNAKTITDNSSCAANYTIKNIEEVSAAAAFSKVVITWVDANGVTYSSNNELQPGDSSFEILSVIENQKNEKDQPTKKIHAKFKCKLYSNTKSINIEGAEILICVAYK